jgi:NADH-quinone oxidoreductase subunit F
MDSGLRGRGGAGFSCGLKWSFVDRKSGKPIYLICNADESEPGTFKDRQILHKDPHQLLEGMILSLLRQRRAPRLHLHPRRVPEGARILNRALRKPARGLPGANILGSGYDLEIHVHRGAGAYICGEETGLIESLEGKRPYPRIKPPYFPAVLGLYLCPTIVNNVETLCAVKHIVAMGGAEYAKLGTPNNTGTRIVSLSGHVKRPGYYEIEVGKVTLGELIFDPAFGGGLREGPAQGRHPRRFSAKVFKAGEKFKLKRTRPDGTRDHPRSRHARSAL